MYDRNQIVAADQIIHELLRKQNHTLSATRDPELYQTYVMDAVIQELVAIKAEVHEIRVKRCGDYIYMLPEPENGYLCFRPQELQQRFCNTDQTKDHRDLAFFIILIIFAEFFDGDGRQALSREFLEVKSLFNIITDRLKEGVSGMDETEEELYGISYRKLQHAWESLKVREENQSMSKRTKDGFVRGIIIFLRDQGLMNHIEDDDQIRPTRRLEDLMEKDILDKSNYGRIRSIMKDMEKKACREQ